MSDAPLARDEVAALRAANARLREVIGAKDAEVAALQARLEASLAQLEELRAEVEALRAQLRQNPRNSSKPPSAGGLGSRRQSRCGRSQGAGRAGPRGSRAPPWR